MRKTRGNSADFQKNSLRFSFVVDAEIAVTFKALAAIKKLNIEELGQLAIKELIKKEKDSIKKWSVTI